MSGTTPNRGLITEVDTDDAVATFPSRYDANMSNLDTHSHPASDVVSGVLDPDRLGTGGDGSGDHVLADDGTWIDPPAAGGTGAPVDATYLVTTSDGTLTNEVVVGSVPGGELGGTWSGADGRHGPFRFFTCGDRDDRAGGGGSDRRGRVDRP
jgi:hypothetical protein